MERRESEDRGDGVGEASFEALNVLERFEGVDARDAKSTSSSFIAMTSLETIIEGCCWYLCLHDRAFWFIVKVVRGARGEDQSYVLLQNGPRREIKGSKSWS